MQLIDGRPVYSATDLVGFLACEHLTQLERAALAGLADRPHAVDPELDVLRRRGFEHEQRYLDRLRAEGRTVSAIDPDGYAEDAGEKLRLAAAATAEAMARGDDVVYQATFFDGTWRGHADFLLRVTSPERPSRWGAYHYEVADTKLARHVKASAVLQMCSYVDALTAVQGVEPEFFHVVLGGGAHPVSTLRVADYMAYYRAARARFQAAVAADAAAPAYPPAATYPEPVEHCRVCRWEEDCVRRRRNDDHLSLVAGISARQRHALADGGVPTVEALAALPLTLFPAVEGTSAAALERVREQARIQVQGRRAGRVLHEVLPPPPGQPPEAERGLATLPEPDPGDLFFDIEGDPYALDDGLDYLFGLMETDGTWHAIWATDADGAFTSAGEKSAFERVVDLITERLRTHPSAHVYHYAPYEPTALKRLMGRHATREEDIDRLLRGGVMIDLYRAVRQGIRASVESYSIKRLEPLYGFTRDVELRDATSSIVEFEAWLELAEGERPQADHLDRIERYNRDDVVSTRQLRDWLEAQRAELAALSGHPVPRPALRDPEPAELMREDLDRVSGVAEDLTRGLPVDLADRTDEEQARWLLAQLLSWHRREDKSVYWLFHHYMGMRAAQLVEESDPIGELYPVEPCDQPSKRGLQTWRYRFPAQEHDVGAGAEVYDPALQQANPAGKISEWRAGRVVAVDERARTIEIRRRVAGPHPTAAVPLSVVDTKAQRASLLRIGEWIAAHPDGDAGPYRVAWELLLRRPPRVDQASGASLRLPGETDLAAARRLGMVLEHSALPIQGPPGSGKTYAGARMIVDLVRAGRRVGISATSHKVIGNMLRAIAQAADEAAVPVSTVQKATAEQAFEHASVQVVDDNAEMARILASGEASVGAGTAWLWARPELERSVDTLVVDEAGQMSLANVVAISPAGGSLILLGDPQQLEQPQQGTHPPGAERSALAHLLGSRATIADDAGLFLERTWRLHPDLCAFTSDAFYDGRLQPEPHLAAQRVIGPAPMDGTGPRLLGVPHAGNDNESPEEAAEVARIARLLVESRARWIDQHGNDQPIGWREILIVAPYNAQVGAIQRLLPEANVGTVDKFQGQEAPISIYSMTSSSAADAPRGLGFLYSRNRLNVATSRARCVALVVASPELGRVRARTPEDMRLANALCRFLEFATDGSSGS